VRFGRRNTAANQIRFLGLDVGAQLVIERVLELTSMQSSAKPIR
jgi:hypothetical protein